MNDINYVRATGDHVQLLVDSRIDFLSEYWGKQDGAVENKLRDELRSFFESEIPKQTYISWLALDGSQLVAVGGMKIIQKPGSFRVPDGKCGYIMNMYTHPGFRRRGIAMNLLHKLIDDGKRLGIHFFELHATKEGEPVYVKDGFQLHKEPTYRKIILD